MLGFRRLTSPISVSYTHLLPDALPIVGGLLVFFVLLFASNWQQYYYTCLLYTSKVDTILMPASPRTAFKFGEISDPTQMYLSDLYTISLNICGNGGISVPLGLGEDTELPVSAQLVGPAFKDRQLLTFARALERGFADAATGAPALSVAPDFAGKGGEL